MENIVKLIVDNGVAIAVIVYFMFVNYKFNEKYIETMTKICDTLENIERRLDNDNKS